MCAEALERLGARGAPLAGGLLERIGELCAGGDDAGGGASDSLLLAAQGALGSAIRALGPEAVLAALPLNLAEGLAGTGEARTWLLPLLRMHVRGARLGYWGRVLLPLARELGSRAATAGAVPARAREAQVCSALEAQVWATLPPFCSWAQDTPEAFRCGAGAGGSGAAVGVPALSCLSLLPPPPPAAARLPLTAAPRPLPRVPRPSRQYSKPLAAAFEKRPDLRVVICHALRRLCTQTRAALAAAGEPVGHADPCAVASAGVGGDEEGAPVSQEEEAHLDPPEGYSADMARE